MAYNTCQGPQAMQKGHGENKCSVQEYNLHELHLPFKELLTLTIPAMSRTVSSKVGESLSSVHQALPQQYPGWEVHT